MRVLVTGASGLVGMRLCRRLLETGHTPVVLSRDPAAHGWPAGTEAHAWDGNSAIPVDVQADAVVNLVGERVIGKRWSPEQKQRLRDSRILATHRVVEWIEKQAESGSASSSSSGSSSSRSSSSTRSSSSSPKSSSNPTYSSPKSNHHIPVLVSASAAGYYGTSPSGPCLESREPGSDFLAGLCVEWEDAANASPGRIVVLRFGRVLAKEGGYLGTLLPFARIGAAGPIAGGKQPVPWVHVDDVVEVILWALTTTIIQGPFNVVSPGAAGMQQGRFAKGVAQTIHRPLQLPVPAFGLRLRFGNAIGPVLLGGQDLRADRLLSAGYHFRHPQLSEALQHLLR